MRKVAIAVLVLGLMATSASAQVFPDARDTGLCGHSSEVLISTGISGQHRAAKNYQHQMIMDWETEAIADYIVANKPPALDTQVELFLCVSGVSNNTINVATYKGNDWREGQTTSYDWLTWPAGIANAEATFDSAQTVTTTTLDPFRPGPPPSYLQDLVATVRWSNQQDGTDVTDFRYIYDNPGLVNSASTAVDSTMSQYDWISVILDDAVVDELLGDPLNRGLYVYGPDWGNSNLYSRDQSGGAYAPYLEVTFVPEPATMSLLVLGGLAALIRRKR